jgi:integrase/recombinase XerD
MGVAHICQHAGHTAKLTKGMYPHLLRHSFAPHRLAAGVDLRRIPLLLGHASLRSTSLSRHVAHPALHATESPLDALA